MTLPALSRKRAQSGRSYVHPVTGETVPSVTTITGMKDKSGALVGWAVKETVNYTIDNWEELSSIGNKANRAKIMKGARYEVTASGTDLTASALGTLVHQAFEDRILGRVPSLPEEARGFLKQFDDFCDRYSPEWKSVERTVWNRTHGYAGTGDGRLQIGDTHILVDFKTGNGVYPEYALQLEALARGEFEIGNDGTETPIDEIHKLAVLHVRPDFWELTPVRDERRDANWEAFKALLNVWQWDQESHLTFGGSVRGVAGEEPLL